MFTCFERMAKGEKKITYTAHIDPNCNGKLHQFLNLVDFNMSQYLGL